MLNKFMGIGRVVNDKVELRHISDDVSVAKFTLAINRPSRNGNGKKNKKEDGKREKEADFIDIVVWRKQAETCSTYLSKGRLVHVEGRLQIRSYEDRNGVRRRAAEVVAESVIFLDSKRDGTGSATGEPDADVPPHLMDGADSGLDDLNLDDELPF